MFKLFSVGAEIVIQFVTVVSLYDVGRVVFVGVVYEGVIVNNVGSKVVEGVVGTGVASSFLGK